MISRPSVRNFVALSKEHNVYGNENEEAAA